MLGDIFGYVARYPISSLGSSVLCGGLLGGNSEGLWGARPPADRPLPVGGGGRLAAMFDLSPQTLCSCIFTFLREKGKGEWGGLWGGGESERGREGWPGDRFSDCKGVGRLANGAVGTWSAAGGGGGQGGGGCVHAAKPLDERDARRGEAGGGGGGAVVRCQTAAGWEVDERPGRPRGGGPPPRGGEGGVDAPPRS